MLDQQIKSWNNISKVWKSDQLLKVRSTFPGLAKYIKCAEISNKENNQTHKSWFL